MRSTGGRSLAFFLITVFWIIRRLLLLILLLLQLFLLSLLLLLFKQLLLLLLRWLLVGIGVPTVFLFLRLRVGYTIDHRWSCFDCGHLGLFISFVIPFALLVAATPLRWLWWWLLTWLLGNVQTFTTLICISICILLLLFPRALLWLRCCVVVFGIIFNSFLLVTTLFIVTFLILCLLLLLL